MAMREASNSTISSQRLAPKYHGKASEVDESLFATPKKGSRSRSQSNSPSKEQTHQASKENRRAQSREDSGEIAAITISRHELDRMRATSSSPTKEQLAQSQAAAQQQAEAAQALAQERTRRMLEMEDERRRQQPPSEMEVIRRAERDAHTAKASAALQEQRDEVKAMNAMLAYAKCAAIRDGQLREKEEHKVQEVARQQQLDALQEADRVAALHEYEAREKHRQQVQRQGARVLEQQLQERELERQRQQDLLLQEGVRLVAAAKQQEAEEKAAQAAKIEAGRELLATVIAGNAALAESKKMATMMEVQQDAAIRQYQLDRDRREQDAAEAKEQAEKAKDMAVAKLWASQKKAADRRSEIDELRARRWQDAAERDARSKEAATQERQAAVQADLAAARAAQAASRVQARAAQAQQQAQDHARVQAEIAAVAMQQLQLEEAAAAGRKQHVSQLRGQISEHEAVRKRAEAAKMAEGRELQRKQAQDKAIVEAAKQRKLAEMAAMGVPEKYRAELARFRPMS